MRGLRLRRLRMRRLRMRLAAVVVAGVTAVVIAGLTRVSTIGRRFNLRIFLFLYDLLKTVVNIRQLDRPVA